MSTPQFFKLPQMTQTAVGSLEECFLIYIIICYSNIFQPLISAISLFGVSIFFFTFCAHLVRLTSMHSQK